MKGLTLKITFIISQIGKFFLEINFFFFHLTFWGFIVEWVIFYFK